MASLLRRLYIDPTSFVRSRHNPTPDPPPERALWNMFQGLEITNQIATCNHHMITNSPCLAEPNPTAPDTALPRPTRPNRTRPCQTPPNRVLPHRTLPDQAGTHLPFTTNFGFGRAFTGGTSIRKLFFSISHIGRCLA